MEQNELMKSLYKDILAALEKNHIDLGTITDFNIDISPQRSVIEFGESYTESLFTIQFQYKKPYVLTTAEDEHIFIESIPHPSRPNMRKELNHQTGETSITIDGIPVKKHKSWIDKVLG